MTADSKSTTAELSERLLMRPESIKDIFCEVEPLDRTNGIILGKFSKAGARGEDLIVSIPLDGKHYKYNSLGQLALTTNSSGQRVPIREKLATNGNRHMMIIGVPAVVNLIVSHDRQSSRQSKVVSP